MLKLVKIAKKQICWACARKFIKGTKLYRIVCADGLEIRAAYFCATCDEWFNRYYDGESVECGALRHDEEWIKIRKEIPGGYK